MKKFVVLLIVLALTLISTSAFAIHAEETDQPGIVKSEPGVTSGVAMTFSGSIEIRERFYNIDATPRTTNAQERVRFNVDAKVGDYLNGRISIENDWDTFGRNEAPQGNASGSVGFNQPTALSSTAGRLDLREAWMNFMIPGIPVGVKAGHQLMQLGNGWFFRSMKYGSDAWVVYNDTGNNTLAFYDVRVGENVKQPPATAQPDQDIDFYGILDAYKLADGVVSIDFTYAYAPSGGLLGGATKDSLYNLGLTYAAKTGPIHLRAEVDIQSGKSETNAFTTPAGQDRDFKGYQAVVQASAPMDPLTINATLAYGTGHDSADATDQKQIITVLDTERHYTLIYEYLLTTGSGGLHTGFANTMAASLGGEFKISKSVAVGLEYWYLQAVEDVAINGGAPDSNLGQELDATVNWKLYDNLTWNWRFGWFMPGDAYKHGTVDAEDSTAVYGMLSFKF